MWRRLRDATAGEQAWLRRMKRLKLYADEDIEEAVVGALREEGINITSGPRAWSPRQNPTRSRPRTPTATAASC
jgi:hypothetical protein